MKDVLVVFSILCLLSVNSCSEGTASETNIRVEQNRDLASRINTEKPVKISLKRTSKGAYTWNISGNDVESILKADRQLRKELGNHN